MHTPYNYATLTTALRAQPDLLVSAANLVMHGPAYPENTWRRAVVEGAVAGAVDPVWACAVAWSCYLLDDRYEEETTRYVVRTYLKGWPIPANKRGTVRAHLYIADLFFINIVDQTTHARDAYVHDYEAFAVLLRLMPLRGP